MSKSSFLGYVKDRLGGFELDTGTASMAPSWQKEFDDFPEYYTDYFKKYSSAVTPLRRIICTGPITLRRPGAAAEGHRQPQGGGRGQGRRPRSSCRPPGRAGSGGTRYYDTYEEYLHHVAEAMREEYLGHRGRRLRAPGRRPVAHRHAERSDEGAGGAAAGRRPLHVEALNHALRDIPTDRIRHHTCYGLNHGPRMNDIPLADRARVHAPDRRRRLLLRGRQPPPHARVADLGDDQAARRQDHHPGPARPRQQLRRAPGPDRGVHRQVRQPGRARRT